MSLLLHRDVNPQSTCGGQVSLRAQEMFGEDYWCVYCGAKWSDQKFVEEKDYAVTLVIEVKTVISFAPGQRDGPLTPSDALGNAWGSTSAMKVFDDEGFSTRVISEQAEEI